LVLRDGCCCTKNLHWASQTTVATASITFHHKVAPPTQKPYKMNHYKKYMHDKRGNVTFNGQEVDLLAFGTMIQARNSIQRHDL